MPRLLDKHPTGRGVVIYEEEEALGLSKSPLLRQRLQPCIPTLLQYSSSAALIFAGSIWSTGISVP